MRTLRTCVVSACFALAPMACSDSEPEAHAATRADVLERKAAALDNRLDALIARVQGDELEAKYHDALADLEERRVAVRQHMERLADRTAATWDDMKAETERAMDELDREIEALAKKLDAAIEKAKS